MLQSLVAYARGASVDARWSVIDGEPDFFSLTKRIHHKLHGSPGDGGPLGPAEREVYERVTRVNAERLAEELHEGDVILLHDPQTAGMAPGADRQRRPPRLALAHRDRHAERARARRLGVPAALPRRRAGVHLHPPRVRPARAAGP